MKKLGKTGWSISFEYDEVVLVDGDNRYADFAAVFGNREETRQVLREALEALDAPPDLAEAAYAMRDVLDGSRVSKKVRDAVETLLNAVDRELES